MNAGERTSPQHTLHETGEREGEGSPEKATKKMVSTCLENQEHVDTQQNPPQRAAAATWCQKKIFF